MSHGREYRCPACEKALVFGATRCGHCGEEAPVYNRPLFWQLFYPACAGLVLLTVYLLVI